MLFEADYAKNYASIMYQCLIAIRKKLKIRRCEVPFNFRHFCVSKVTTTAHAHKNGVIFHIFSSKKLRSYDQR